MCGRYDAALSERGRTQVERLRIRLAEEARCAALYSSPLRRAIDTASAAPAELTARLRPLNSLREIYCGIVDGWPLQQVQAQYPDAWRANQQQSDENFCWPGGESYKQFRRRVLRVLRRIAEQHPGERVLVFTHAGVINQLVGSINGQTPARWENHRPENASITEVRWNSVGPELVSFGDCRHLQLSSNRPPAG